MGINLGPHPDASDDYIEGWKAGRPGLFRAAGVKPYSGDPTDGSQFLWLLLSWAMTLAGGFALGWHFHP